MGAGAGAGGEAERGEGDGYVLEERSDSEEEGFGSEKEESDFVEECGLRGYALMSCRYSMRLVVLVRADPAN